MPPSGSVADYITVSSDSIYFPGGNFVNVGTSTAQAQSSGAKLKFQGDKLIMTFNVSDVSIQNVFGLRQTTTRRVKGVMTLQKM